MIKIFKKELANYFMGYMAYISASAFVLICTLFLWFFDNEFNIFNIGTATLSSFFFIAPWVLFFLIPALTMRTISEEENNGTLQWLFTQPIKICGIVWGKFLPILVVLLFAILPTYLFVYTMEQFIVSDQILDYGALLSGYLGLFLLGSSFAAIGIFTSSLTKNQVAAYVSAIFLCFFFFYAFESLASYNLLGTADYYVQKIGMYQHYQQMLKGILDTRDLIYFFVLIGVFLALTNANLIRKK
ncbi:ABC transporter permease subunit [Moheibacter stercoris]|uniref:ABC-2 type transport system permease protein n=1 Tax=Moheibacter stercoris TaxID=1628251 RepID=A0ABV2LVJ2_9FLAO